MRVWKSRWLRRVAFGIAVFGVVLVGTREFARRKGERDLAALVAQVDASDPDWRWNELNSKRPRVTGDGNSALLVPRINALLPQSRERWTEDPSYVHLLDRPPNRCYPESVVARARRELDTMSAALALARTLKDHPRGHRHIDLAPNPIQTQLGDAVAAYHVAELLRWDTVLASERGDTELIADNLIATLNASRSIGDEPFLLSQLVRIACRDLAVRSIERSLAQARPEALPPQQLESLQNLLADDATAPLLQYALRGERAINEVVFEKVDAHAMDIENDAIGEPARRRRFNPNHWLYRGYLPGDRAHALRWFTSAIEITHRPIHEQRAGFEALPTPERDLQFLLSRLYSSGVKSAATRYWRDVAEMRCAVAGVACERYRLCHGHWPDSLAQLADEWLPDVPLDPFDGEPLRYRSLQDGVVVYSAWPPSLLGETRFDPVREDHLVPRRGLPEGIRVGFRLWDPDARRLDPKPEATP